MNAKGNSSKPNDFERKKILHDIKKLFITIYPHTLLLETASGVFSPDSIDKGTKLLLENIVLPDVNDNGNSLNVLDLGAGYGAITIWICKELSINCPKTKKFQVFSSEIEFLSLKLLKRNIILNNCKNYVDVLKGNFIETTSSLKKKGIEFDAIFSNPSFEGGQNKTLLLFKNAMESLSSRGYIQYVHQKKQGAEGFLNKLRELKPSWSFQVILKRSGYHIIIISPIKFDLQSK